MAACTVGGAAYFIAEEASVSSDKIVVLLRYHSGLMNGLAVLDEYQACILGPVGGVHSFTCLGVVARLALFNHSSAPEMAGRDEPSPCLPPLPWLAGCLQYGLWGGWICVEVPPESTVLSFCHPRLS